MSNESSGWANPMSAGLTALTIAVFIFYALLSHNLSIVVTMAYFCQNHAPYSFFINLLFERIVTYHHWDESWLT